MNDSSRQSKNGLLHNTELEIVKWINQTICSWQSRRYRPEIQKINFRRGLPIAQRILLLVPHMDDEVIGCAGLISQYHRIGTRVVCVYLTDSAGNQTGNQRLSSMATRMRETKTAGRSLGIQQTYFLNQPDGRLRKNPALIEKMRTILEKETPQLLLLPFPCDPHPDHKVISLLAAKTLEKSRFDGIAAYFYQLRAPIPLEDVDLALDISDFLEAKRMLLREYRSQSQFVFDLALHLQSCQGILFGRDCRAVEVFAAAPRERLAAMSGKSTKSFRQVKRHLHVGLNALWWHGSGKSKKIQTHSIHGEGIPCS